MQGMKSSKLEKLLSFWHQDNKNLLIIKDILSCYVENKELDEAQQFFRNLPSQIQSELEIRWHFGQQLVYAGHLSDAMKIFQSLPDTEDFLREYGMALCLFFQREFQKSSDLLRSICHQDLKSVPAQIVELYARGLFFLGELQLARNTLQKLPQQTLDSLGLLSLIVTDMGNYSEAESMADEVRQHSVSQQDALVTKITCLLWKLDNESGLVMAQQAVQQYPDNGRLWSLFGQGQMLSQQIPEALQTLQHATLLMPEHIGTWHLKAWCELLGNDLIAAESSFESALELNRNFAESHGGLAVVQANKGDLMSAERTAKIAVRLDPECISGRFALSLVARATGDVEQADNQVQELMNSSTHIPGTTYLQLLQLLQR